MSWVITIVSSVTNFFIEKINFVWMSKRKCKRQDKLLFDELITILPVNSDLISFLSFHDIGAPFSENYTLKLLNVICFLEKSDKIFHTKKIETQRIEFTKSIKLFSSQLSLKTRCIENNLVTIKATISDKTIFEEDKEYLNRLSSETFNQYNILIKLCQKVLI